ncbi:NUCB2 [Cervus elaphus hippelaphus]|uniref:NUCB2 n=1 Tax=Cervus elaphus hippelaphus TaxID=46360 RepID=A0A212DHJ1_CEREH|nr:NUCB2 [Cervus elaphus hippelaphus]
MVMKWRTILPQCCFLLFTCSLTTLEAVPIDIDKTKVKSAQPVDSAKIEPPDTGLYYDEYLKQVIDVLETDNTGIDHHALLKQFDHLNHLNPDKFESRDLDMLIKAGSKDQLKEVWEEADGLDPNDFDPKTFFKLHDVNSDGFLDEQELEALFTKELEKVYDPKNEEDDMVEMEEERLRMREHVMNETLDQQQFFTEEELKEYENLISVQESKLKKKADELQKQKEDLQRQHDQLEAQKLEYHQVFCMS